MNLSETIAIARKSPGMFIGSFEKKVDVVGCYLNFLLCVLDQTALGVPHRIEFISYGEHHSAFAYGCQLPIEDVKTENLVEWIYNKRRNPQTTEPLVSALFSLEWLNCIVLVSNYCVYDFSTTSKQVRQIYYEASPASPCATHENDKALERVPYVGLCFSLSPEVFENRTISPHRMRKAWRQFRQSHSNPSRTDNNLQFFIPNLPGASMESKVYGDDMFIMKLEWNRI